MSKIFQSDSFVNADDSVIADTIKGWRLNQGLILDNIKQNAHFSFQSKN